MSPFKLILYIHKKTWSQSLLPGPHSEGSRIALFIQPSNAESPTPMYHRRSNLCRILTCKFTPSRGVPVALFLTNSQNLRDSQNVKTKASRKRLLYVCMSPSITPLHEAELRTHVAKLRINFEINKKRSEKSSLLCMKCLSQRTKLQGEQIYFLLNLTTKLDK